MVVNELGNGVEASPTGSLGRVEGLALPLVAKVVDRSAVFEGLSSKGLDGAETLGAGTLRFRLWGQREQGVDDVREGFIRTGTPSHPLVGGGGCPELLLNCFEEILCGCAVIFQGMSMASSEGRQTPLVA